MKTKKLNLLIACILLLVSLPVTLQAQGSEIDMADTMRSNGKIYVVVSVVSIILVGLLFYLISIDRRVQKIENERKKDNSIK
jgi:uncharacterized membrane protein YqhA